MKQSTLTFKKGTCTEKEKRTECLQRMELADIAKEKWDEQAQKAKQSKAEHEKELNRVRQKRWREKQKAKKNWESTSETADVNDVLMEGASQTAEMDLSDIAGVLRAGYEDWRNERNGTKRGAVQVKPKQTNWFHPFLWTLIEQAMK
ncbi:hypothetical protein PQX77_015622 [Marasmius sp. AFHP31]|nr:hypothetical protein PQX77_015622 [Marasmius sp. AFHP31]